MPCACDSATTWPLTETRLNVFVGSAPSWSLLIADPATGEALTGGIAGSSWAFNVSTSAGVAVLSLSTDGGEIVITSVSDCTIQIDWTAALTGLLTAGTGYRYELTGELASGEIYVALYGVLSARASLPSA